MIKPRKQGVAVVMKAADLGKTSAPVCGARMFYVYQQRKRGSFRFYPDNWILAGVRSTESEAVALAESLCPKGRRIDTEPGHGLSKAFFGSIGTSGWSAMIDTKNIHKDRKAK